MLCPDFVFVNELLITLLINKLSCLWVQFALQWVLRRSERTYSRAVPQDQWFPQRILGLGRGGWWPLEQVGRCVPMLITQCYSTQTVCTCSECPSICHVPGCTLLALMWPDLMEILANTSRFPITIEEKCSSWEGWYALSHLKCS